MWWDDVTEDTGRWRSIYRTSWDWTDNGAKGWLRILPPWPFLISLDPFSSITFQLRVSEMKGPDGRRCPRQVTSTISGILAGGHQESLLALKSRALSTGSAVQDIFQGFFWGRTALHSGLPTIALLSPKLLGSKHHLRYRHHIDASSTSPRRCRVLGQLGPAGSKACRVHFSCFWMGVTIRRVLERIIPHWAWILTSWYPIAHPPARPESTLHRFDQAS